MRRKPYSVLLLDEIERPPRRLQHPCCRCSTTGSSPTAGAGWWISPIPSSSPPRTWAPDIIQRRPLRPAAPPARIREDQVRGDGRAARTLPPEFLNRIDEIIVFHALGREEIRHIVGLQLDRVARNAASQGVTLTFDQTLIDHFAEEGYKPELARELKRLIRSELETALAREMLGGGIGRPITPAPAGTTRPNGWSSSARSHPRNRPSLKSPMPRTWPRRRRATRASLPQEEVSGRRILSDGRLSCPTQWG